ncbi:MAG: DUF1788 domain-containing protein [Leptospiraceae bacterium]|nr:DUF1788 domain-containing protein [Leptospiraceae bacterium]
MNRIKKLIESYSNFISVPWREGVAAEQRVIFCIYNMNDELKLRSHLGEFQLATSKANHSWFQFDLTDTFAEWMSQERYAKSFFKKPETFPDPPEYYLKYLIKKFETYLKTQEVDDNSVVCIYGVASLFGFLSVSNLVKEFSRLLEGRLVVMFPGSYENNIYRHLDAYDGWNYHAIPITSNKDF